MVISGEICHHTLSTHITTAHSAAIARLSMKKSSSDLFKNKIYLEPVVIWPSSGTLLLAWYTLFAIICLFDAHVSLFVIKEFACQHRCRRIVYIHSPRICLSGVSPSVCLCGVLSTLALPRCLRCNLICNA